MARAVSPSGVSMLMPKVRKRSPAHSRCRSRQSPRPQAATDGYGPEGVELLEAVNCAGRQPLTLQYLPESESHTEQRRNQGCIGVDGQLVADGAEVSQHRPFGDTDPSQVQGTGRCAEGIGVQQRVSLSQFHPVQGRGQEFSTSA